MQDYNFSKTALLTDKVTVHNTVYKKHDIIYTEKFDKPYFGEISDIIVSEHLDDVCFIYKNIHTTFVEHLCAYEIKKYNENFFCIPHASLYSHKAININKQANGRAYIAVF